MSTNIHCINNILSGRRKTLYIPQCGRFYNCKIYLFLFNCLKQFSVCYKINPQLFFFPFSQNKLKKIKEKYKDQDEEDRELMMQLLGVRRAGVMKFQQLDGSQSRGK